MNKRLTFYVVFLFFSLFLCGISVTNALADDVNNTESYKINPDGKTVETRFPAPKGFERKSYDDPYAKFLREFPLLPDGSPVKLYNGNPKENQSSHVAVLDLDPGKLNLMHSSHAAQRLRAEYLYKTEQFDRIVHHFSNGQEISWNQWRKGWRVQVEGAKGEKTTLVKTNLGYSNYNHFKYYLGVVFKYAGVRSLMDESRRVDTAKMRPGNVFVSKGHVVIILDIVEDNAGHKKVLLAQGQKVAQQIEILKNPDSDNPWYDAHDLDYCPLKTPEWVFECPEEGIYSLP